MSRGAAVREPQAHEPSRLHASPEGQMADWKVSPADFRLGSDRRRPAGPCPLGARNEVSADLTGIDSRAIQDILQKRCREKAKVAAKLEACRVPKLPPFARQRV